MYARASKKFAATVFCFQFAVAEGGDLFGVWFEELLFRKGRREGASGVLVRLVSLWWEFPPRLDSNNNILFPQKQQFFVFQNDFRFGRPIEISYDYDITSGKGSYANRSDISQLVRYAAVSRGLDQPLTSTPAQSSKIRITEQKSSSP